MKTLKIIALCYAALGTVTMGCSADWNEIVMSDEEQKSEHVQAIADGLVTIKMRLPIPNQSNLPLRVKNASFSEVGSLKHGGSLYLISRSWDFWRQDFAFGEIGVDVVLRRSAAQEGNSFGTAQSLKRYLQHNVDDSEFTHISMSGHEWIHYSLSHKVDDKSIRKASEMYALPLSTEYYLLVAFRFNDPEKTYSTEWMRRKKEEARSIFLQIKVDKH